MYSTSLTRRRAVDLGRYVDPRGPRFGAWLTTAVLALVLLTGSAWLAAAQTVVFLAGAVFGLAVAPYGVLYRLLLRPRLGPPAELEAELPPRFAQAVGAAFGAVATLGYATGVTALGVAAASLALAAAFLNAAFALCLGCEVLLLARRVLGRAEIVRFVPRSAHKGASA
jgi:hypothetical protein